MITCPNCGHSVPSNQRFCGNCGYDVQSAAAARGAPVSDQQSAPYAYAQPPGYGGYEQSYPQPSSSRGPGRILVVGAVLILVACCALACGFLIGLELPDAMGLLPGGATPRPTPRVAPTPAGWVPFVISFFI